jgi:hypothetical protein
MTTKINSIIKVLNIKGAKIEKKRRTKKNGKTPERLLFF